VPAPEAYEDMPESLRTVRALRTEAMHAEVLAVAELVLESDIGEVALTAGDQAALQAQGSTYWSDSSLEQPVGRSELQLLGAAVGDPDVVAKAWSLRGGEELRVAGSSLGIALACRGLPEERKFMWHFECDDADPQNRSDAVGRLVAALQEQSAGFSRAKREISDALVAGQLSAYSTEGFAWGDNADRLVSFLSGQSSLGSSGSPGGVAAADLSAYRQTAVDALYSLPARHHEDKASAVPFSRAGVYYDDQGAIEKILVPDNMPGLYRGLRPTGAEGQSSDISELSYHIGVELAPDEAQVGLGYGNRYYEGAVSFAESETAAHLFGAFDAAGLRLQEDVLKMCAEIGSARHGNAYSDLTREIAKLVDDRSRPLARLFEDTTEDSIRHKISQLQDTPNVPAQTVANLLKGIVGRDGGRLGVISLPISAARVELRDGSCKDAEYYIAAAGTPSANDTLLYHSSYRRPSVMTLHPVMLNGVVLPSGSLLAQEPDGYLFMRVTGFAFNDSDALDAFGSQEAENRGSVYGDVRNGGILRA